MNSPPLEQSKKELEKIITNVQLEKKLNDEPNVNKNEESTTSSDTDVEAECETTDESDEESQDELSDDTRKELSEDNSSISRDNNIPSASSSSLQRVPKCTCICRCGAQKRKKNIHFYRRIESPTEDNRSSRSSSSSSATKSSSDKEESSSIESSPPRRRKLRRDEPANVARSCTKIKSIQTNKSTHKIKHKERSRFCILRTVSDIIFWPFLFFRSEK